MEAATRPFRGVVCLACAAVFAASCVSQPAQPAPPPERPQPVDRPVTSRDTGGPGDGGFVASEELYRTTFHDVQKVIAAITRLISAGDYDGWVSYLTEDYITSTSSKAFLADASRAQVLKKNGIVLKSLRDYFNNVVVQSHLQATLDDIQFLDETHVKAIALVQGTPVILYYLVRENGGWKVGLMQPGQS